MSPLEIMIVIAVAVAAVALIIDRYRSEQRLRKSMQDWQRSQERLLRSQDQQGLSQDRFDRTTEAINEVIALAKAKLAERDGHDAALPTISDGDNGKAGQANRFCSNCNGGQIRPAQLVLRRAVIMGAGGAMARRSKVRYYARRGRRRNVAGIRAQAVRRPA